MAVAHQNRVLNSSLQKVWSVVTSLTDYAWRSGLEKIEILEGGKRFVEYTKGGFATRFIITAFEPFSRYAFTMENENICGHWTGVFTETADGVVVDFTEEITAKKTLMKPFVGIYLRRQQESFMRDLQKALEAAE